MINKISIIGSGYVGLVSAACFSEVGLIVTCIDNNVEKIKRLNASEIPIYEPGLEAMIARNVKENRLCFDTNIQQAVQNSQVIFIAVGTPTSPQDGQADLTSLKAVTREMAPFINEYKIIVVKSTVPVGTCRMVKKIIQAENPKAKFDIVSNPEFLREGSAVHDFMHPDRIVIGVESDQAQVIMDKIYGAFIKQAVPLFYTDLESSELIKYATNCFLATKIAFINELANICEKTGANIEEVSAGLGLDNRIGRGHLKPGPAFGGSCFPKDTLALVHTAREVGAPLSIVEAVIHSNERRKIKMAETIMNACQGSVKDKTIAVLGVAFKANTNDIRESAALVLIEKLQQQGAKLVVYDPVAMPAAQEVVQNVTWAQDAYNAISAAEVVAIVTEWQEFANLDFSRAKMNPIVIDFRNLYDPSSMLAKGIAYISVGRKSTRQLSKENKQSALLNQEVI